MAGLPPDTIHVKRKRGEEEPVDFLHFERSKRSRSQSGDGAWVYQRKQSNQRPADHATPSPPVATVPTIQATRDGDDVALSKRAPKRPLTAAPAAPAKPQQSEPTLSSAPAAERIRRFHLSRSDSPQLPAGVSKKRTAPVVFIERDAKKHRESLRAVIEKHHVEPTDRQPQAQVGSKAEDREEEPAAPPQPSPVKYKRPGTRALKTAPNTRPSPAPPLPDRQDKDMDEMTRLMDSWTLDLIAQDREKMEEQRTNSKYNPATSRFKPKAPKLRYFERHPESLAAKEREKTAQQAAAATTTAMDVSVDDTTDDEDYVLETYERVPAERLLDQEVPAHRVGLLVFDTEPDMVEFFYGNESDSEDDYVEDDVDSNDENFYTNEYPDEELASDDEFDRDPYQYRNQNASDLEEFDERDFEEEQDREAAWTDEVWDRCERLQGQPGWE
ncbi:28cab5d1-a9b1-4af9-b1b7-95f619d0cd6b [Thermothielavioides terrestris]|uniref:Transcription factor Iwr1 domain-containing protein n=2 Tax=Thermothielavioides terrestris TaxID=2587410 RepID=G2RC07_THETT|nr:uncharacterized protein THITE_2119604 [Thermothielavioides terrestris NRRL 8126]AEO69328.1 hypothetical protein THITE_2119604 [Thermothielavioides terrestris NRRL 8126]SPQ22402.1 28cab5d1-a9b1-4af9-b1b7-95f619d0cd6b [Thermothielavioides terrestris]